MGEGDAPRSVLFVCTHNSIRSPMAEALARLRFGPIMHVDSAGVHDAAFADPLAAFVMDELGADLSKHRPKELADLIADEVDPFELIVTLSPEAHHRALDLIPKLGKAAEYWPTFDPSLTEGSREQRLMEYRMVRDGLDKRIRARFPRPSTG
ncbi:MAG TPA: low molecular weight phosphatase family protein [Terricaulis sp.]|nr:low molecular weight phosphatase family protein [Terricaulis sp.]